MAQPTASEIRAFLEGYQISTSILSDEWIDNRVTNFVAPYIERKVGYSCFSEAAESVVEYLSGTGTELLYLSNKNATALTEIRYVAGAEYSPILSLGAVILLPGGILKAVSSLTQGGEFRVFPKGIKNFKVTYTVGASGVDVKLKEACIYLAAEQALGFIGARTGGGSISVQGFSRNFGERGKWQDIRNDLARQAAGILKEYMSSVVGR